MDADYTPLIKETIDAFAKAIKREARLRERSFDIDRDVLELMATQHCAACAKNDAQEK